MATITSNLFAELTADGQTAAFALPGVVTKVSVFLKEGANDGGGTLSAQSTPNGGTDWVAVPNASWTSGDGLLGVYTVYGTDIRFDITGSTTPADVVVQVYCEAVSEGYVVAPTTNAPSATELLTADGTVTATLPVGANAFLYGWGTWGSGTLKLEQSVDGGTTWYDATAGLTADGGAAFTNTAGVTLVRVNLAGATSPSLSWRVFVGA